MRNNNEQRKQIDRNNCGAVVSIVSLLNSRQTMQGRMQA